MEHNDTVLGRWAAVMLNADVYAEVIDRHVELAGDLAWLSGLLGFELSEDDDRTQKSRSHPAALIEGPLDDDQLVQRLAAITQLAEQLDRERSTSPCGSSRSHGGASNWGQASRVRWRAMKRRGPGRGAQCVTVDGGSVLV